MLSFPCIRKINLIFGDRLFRRFDERCPPPPPPGIVTCPLLQTLQLASAPKSVRAGQKYLYGISGCPTRRYGSHSTWGASARKYLFCVFVSKKNPRVLLTDSLFSEELFRKKPLFHTAPAFSHVLTPKGNSNCILLRSVANDQANPRPDRNLDRSALNH